MKKPNGFTLTEVVLSSIILAILMLSFSSLLKYSTIATTKIVNRGESQETARIGLNKIEEALSHANEITLSSQTMVEFIDDIDQNPNYNPNGLGTNPAQPQSIPNYRNSDRANTLLFVPPTACASPGGQWMQAGDNLQNDDEDADCNIDVLKRIYWSNGTVYLDTSINQDAYGQRIQALIPNVSSFTLSYFGSPTMLPSNLGMDNNPADGIIESNEMDCAPPSSQSYYCDGQLDTRLKRKYITYIHIHLEVINSHGSTTVYSIDTDIYPPLLPLKSVAT